MRKIFKTILLLFISLLIEAQVNEYKPLIVKGEESWDKPQEIYSDVIISGRSTLAISSVISFASEAKIIIQPGGQLILDGGKLTNLCPEYWQGIEVRGAPNSDNPDDQGKLIMKNDATIENVLVGVRNIFADEVLHYGGMIQASNSHFINNQVAVQLESTRYNRTNAYVSYFYFCDFETNADYQGTNSFKYFADLDHVNDVVFNHCDFANSQSEYTGIGIKAKEAQFTVNNNSTFENLGYAIQNYGSGSSIGSVIKKSYFTNNYRGIYTSGVNEMEIYDNEFSIPYASEPSTKSHGIYLDRCDGYIVETNEFESYTPSNKGAVRLSKNLPAYQQKMLNKKP